MLRSALATWASQLAGPPITDFDLDKTEAEDGVTFEASFRKQVRNGFNAKLVAVRAALVADEMLISYLHRAKGIRRTAD